MKGEELGEDERVPHRSTALHEHDIIIRVREHYTVLKLIIETYSESGLFRYSGVADGQITKLIRFRF